MKFTNVKHIFALLCTINVLNYINRGIVPGAPIQFQSFIHHTLDVAPDRVSVYIGVLVSTFIAAYSIFICVFGYLSIRRRPFRLAAFGLCLWALAIAISGLARPLNSYYLLLVGRLLSGIGESSFQAVTPSFIDQHAPEHKRTLWLGLFGCAISAGTALGYSYGSLTAQTIGWDWGFILAAIAMMPLAYLCYTSIPDHIDIPMIQESTLAHQDVYDDESRHRGTSLSFFRELWAVVQSPLFLTATFGWAAYSFTIAGLASFGPAILIGSNILGEYYASTAFGAMVVVAGLVGSPLGGFAVDLQCRSHEADADHRLYIVTRQMFTLVTAGIACAFGSAILMDVPAAFFGLLFVGLVMLFMTQSAFTVCVLLSVNRSRQGFALGLSTFLLHLLGDVPSPVLLGYLKDQWAPDCGTVVNAALGREELNPLCSTTGKPGLQLLLFFAYAWLTMTAVFWGLAFVLGRRQLLAPTKRSIFDTWTPVMGPR
ncbi:hypothetical protein H310_12847 [Aphanomyces invadans]|uniref:Major facilitator superfamily (MFS) profile domain-containing protein n=1 Tax=Aphanomyces invadans TaxID=157072 RepID=A0A024TFT0_9STRA|nr:hypothetical protein H310_12847 [Aphanomyces invadans]ETV93015.1 hypothetical protein H310_12847 [Aphanomyces invadans]|eukprot:XP_008878280.1 hypothetical protein H310_12847 [Aphanomyces invadans]